MFVILGAKIWKKNGNEKNGGENDEIWGYFGREWEENGSQTWLRQRQAKDGRDGDGNRDGKATIDGRDGDTDSGRRGKQGVFDRSAMPIPDGYGEHQEDCPNQDQPQKANNDDLKGCQSFSEELYSHTGSLLIHCDIILSNKLLRWY